MNLPSLREIARKLGGNMRGDRVLAPGPDHSPQDRSLQVTLSSTAPDGFLVHSFAGDDDLVCKDWVRAKLGLPEWKSNGGNGKAPESLDDDAQLMKAALEMTPRGYHQTGLWKYPNAEGTHCIFATARYDSDDGQEEKTFRPFIVASGRITSAFPSPRPLYGLDQLAARPNDRVLVVEGEKTADAAAALIPGYVVVTSPGGANAAAKVDWSPLAGRDVVAWPDHDPAGDEYVAAIRKHLPRLKTVKVPETWPPKWDLADTAPRDMTNAGLWQMIDEAGAQIDLEEAIAATEANPLPRSTSSLSDNGKAPESQRAKARKAAAAKLADKYCAKDGSPLTEKQLKETVADMGDVDYDRKRKEIAAHAGIRAPTLDRIRDQARSTSSSASKLPVPDDVRERLLAQYAEAAKHIIASPNVLDILMQETGKVIAGEEDAVKLLYLVATSRLFPKPMNAAIKGPSSAGKSEVREKVLAFFPPESVISFTSMSEKALVFDSRSFQHTVLSMAEAISVEEQGLQDLLLRELMSAGRLTHTMTLKRGNDYDSITITKEGPVAFLVTTTKNALHPENETRMLSLELDDSDTQTGRVIDKVMETEGLNVGGTAIDFEPWREFQRWLAIGNTKVVVPYARELGTLIPCSAVRLRRDSGQILRAIKAHALLHRQHREIDDRDQIIADIEHDYATVWALLSEIVGAATGAKLSKAVRETVDAVRETTKTCVYDSDGASALEIAQLLRLDKSAARRRLLKAQSEALIVNLETRRGQPGRYRVVDREEQPGEILPTPEELRTLLQGLGKSAPPCHPNQKQLTEQKDSGEPIRCECVLMVRRDMGRSIRRGQSG